MWDKKEKSKKLIRLNEDKFPRDPTNSSFQILIPTIDKEDEPK